MQKIKQDAQIKSAQAARVKEESTKLSGELDKLSLEIKALTQGESKLYGSINVHEISLALKEQGFDIDKSLIELPEPIKSLGAYQIPIKLHAEVIAKVKLTVVKK